MADTEIDDVPDLVQGQVRLAAARLAPVVSHFLQPKSFQVLI